MRIMNIVETIENGKSRKEWEPVVMTVSSINIKKKCILE